ncbi:FliM/FliN family flagellar motor switch protein, partial [Shewanella sp. 0m-11]
EGDVVALDRMVGEPLDIRVNGALLGRGEVVEVNGRYGVRLLEVEATSLTGAVD